MEEDTRKEEYSNGSKHKLRQVKDKKLREKLKNLERRYKDAASDAFDSELLLPESTGVLRAEGLERTYKVTQEQLKTSVGESTASKGYDLNLNRFGPYSIDYTRNGRYLLLGGQKGHVACFDWREGILQSENHLMESVRDVQWLHNENYYAVAQKKYVFVYDQAGVELHCLKNHIDVTSMTFLPYHFLLVTAGNAGWLKYQDTSTGKLVAEVRTKLGSCTALAQNKFNAIIHTGHTNGTVCLWSPNMSTQLVKMLSHRGPVTGLTIDRSGKYMVSCGNDRQLKVWDVRTYRELHSYFTPTPAQSINLSDTGLLSVGWGNHATIWKDALSIKQKSPYMSHLFPGSQVHDVQFCPFEDILGAGHNQGFSSLIIPGAGEANFDALEINPFETKKQRQEGEVRSLLTKLQPEMIALNPDFVGKLDPSAAEVDKKSLRERPERLVGDKMKPRDKARGKNSSLRKFLRKKSGNVIDERKMRLEDAIEREKHLRQIRVQKSRGKADPTETGTATLARIKRNA